MASAGIPRTSSANLNEVDIARKPTISYYYANFTCLSLDPFSFMRVFLLQFTTANENKRAPDELNSCKRNIGLRVVYVRSTVSGET